MKAAADDDEVAKAARVSCAMGFLREKESWVRGEDRWYLSGGVGGACGMRVVEGFWVAWKMLGNVDLRSLP